jgi:isoamylase
MRHTALVSDPSHPHPLGIHPRDGGVEVAVLAAHAERVQFCLLDPAGSRELDPDGAWLERRVDLPNRTHGVWHGFIPDVAPGQRYGLRVHGEWNPRQGLRHNPAKLLLDPYARAVVPPSTLRPEVFGHRVGDDLLGNPRLADDRDSAPYSAHGVVTAAAQPTPSTRPRTPWRDTVIYEAHVRGLTRRLPGLPDHLRGTYAALGHPWTVEHLTRLGITALELLPVLSFLPEAHLVRREVSNYWGYSTLAFFAPHLAYASTPDPIAAIAEFQQMVAALHAAGIEVLLDVVYNHTCEGGVSGPMLSFRGLDALTYYRLDGDGHDVDFTGTGNSLDASQARVVQLVLDSLRYWAEVMDVDGFRFDLAPTLARDHNEFTPDHPMLVAMRADPVLAGVKLIAEPWDVGPDGWQTGAFPPPFAEWNDRFRDDVREFWLPGAARAATGRSTGGLRDLGTRIAGSADTFSFDRGPLASVNFITAHDGFTLADTTMYNTKRNLANGEDNRDGTDNNRSWNHGIDGPDAPAAVLAARQRSVRNLLGTLLLSAGVPMILAGDEFGRTQEGNNNAYSQDNELSWVNWELEPAQEQLLATTQFLISLRRAFPAVRPSTFYSGLLVDEDAGVKDISWFGPDGAEMIWQRWEDGSLRTLQVLFADPALARSCGDEAGNSLLMVVAGAPQPEEIVLPKPDWVSGFEQLWTSDDPQPPTAPGPVLAPSSTITLAANSLTLFRTT